MDLYHYVLFWICVLGLCMGSFFNVVILRSLKDESIVYPPSKCPKCENKLYWWHNIPVLSYILLRGKCYFCKAKISIQYPIIEILTMVLFAVSFVKFGFTLKTPFVIFWLSGLLIMTMTDLKEKLVDCNIAIAMGVSGLIYNGITGSIEGLISSTLGFLAGVVVLELIARLGCLFKAGRVMGEADTYVAGAFGAMFGLQNIMPVLFYGLIASMIFIVPMFLYNQFKAYNKGTCIFSVLFILSCLVFKLLWQNWWTMSALILIGLALAVSILRSIKQEENRNYLPYVPALAVGALYFIFFSINF